MKIWLLGLLLALAGWFYIASRHPGNTNLIVRVLDVGQGDSIHIKLPDNTDIVIDAGPNDNVLAQLGRSMTIGDRKIELLIITHNHADHIGGLTAILNSYRVERIWLSGAVYTTDQYRRARQTILDRRIPTTTVKAGNSLTVSDGELVVLHPPIEMTGQEPADQHDATIVVKLIYKQFCVWLTGDLNSAHEPLVLEAASQLNQSIECQILKVTHHGSAAGTSNEFLQAVKPKIGIISTGRGNRYGHPAPSLLARLKKTGVRVFRTDQQGTVTVTSDGQKFWTKSDQ